MSVRASLVTPGVFLVPDDGFTCLKKGYAYEVKVDDPWELYIECEDGKHFISGGRDFDNEQDEVGHYVGFVLLRKETFPKLDEAAFDLLAACIEFVRKCDCGDARSRCSYTQMKAAIARAIGEDDGSSSSV